MECLVLYTGVTRLVMTLIITAALRLLVSELSVMTSDMKTGNQMITTLRYPHQNSGRQIHLKINSVVNNHSTGWVLRLGSK